MSYPEYANIDGERYKINTDYRVALRCFEVINDPGICDEERTLAVIYLLFGFVPEDRQLQSFLDKATMFLQCGKTAAQHSDRPVDMDFEFDRQYINASFMSDYKIDLNKTDLHFWQFCELIQGLTENSALSRIRELRTYDLSEVKDAKTKLKIAKAQAEVALPKRHTQEEIDAIERFERLYRGDG